MTLMMRRLRESRGHSQSKLARLSDLNQTTVNMIENQRLRPYPSQLARIAEALGVAPEDAESLLEEAGDD